MKKYDLITPEGTSDKLFGDCVIRRSIEKSLEEIFVTMGYSEIMTPGLEFFDVFSLNSRHFPQEGMYKLTDNKGRLLAVRPDSTVPIARVIASRLRDYAMPQRFFYRQDVYRNIAEMKGLSGEIRQMGIELIGSDSKKADLELIFLAAEAMSAAGMGKTRFHLEIGDIGFFKLLLNKLEADTGVKEEIRSLIEVKNFPALNAVLDKFPQSRIISALKRLPGLYGGMETLDEALKLSEGDEELSSRISELKDLYKKLVDFYKEGVTVDLGYANRLDYYTGIVIKGYFEGYGAAALSGGRYDGLLNEFGYDCPATGFAVNIDAAAKAFAKLSACEKYAPKSKKIFFGGDELKTLSEAYRFGKENALTVEHSLFDTAEETEKYAALKGIGDIETVT